MAPIAMTPRGTPTPAPIATYVFDAFSSSTGALIAEACMISLPGEVGSSLGTVQEALARRALSVITSPRLMVKGSVSPAHVVVLDELATIEFAQYRAVWLTKLWRGIEQPVFLVLATTQEDVSNRLLSNRETSIKLADVGVYFLSKGQDTQTMSSSSCRYTFHAPGYMVGLLQDSNRWSCRLRTSSSNVCRVSLRNMAHRLQQGSRLGNSNLLQRTPVQPIANRGVSLTITS
ncbi:hypothetical protein H113_08255 [Trichophyton rubrum MR1459]|nr:hypothetical protein H113_08255 [Trichophyton rubrum MR1459]EZG01657.1 hypothetical protein H106_08062 [Trichophyton rubrum CBS 735.88]